MSMMTSEWLARRCDGGLCVRGGTGGEVLGGVSNPDGDEPSDDPGDLVLHTSSTASRAPIGPTGACEGLWSGVLTSEPLRLERRP